MSQAVCWGTIALAAGTALGHWLFFTSGMSCDVRHDVVFSCAVMAACVVSYLGCQMLPTRFRRSRNWFMGGSMMVFFFAVGVARYGIHFLSHLPSWSDFEIQVDGVVITQPSAKGRRTSFVLETVQPVRCNVLVNVWDYDTGPESKLRLGEHVSTYGRISRPRNLGNPDEFDYAKWLWCQGIGGTVNIEGATLSHNTMSAAAVAQLPLLTRLRLRALMLRQRLLSRLASTGLEGQTQAVVSALMLADRSQLSADTRDLYAEAGASHLLALSGLHLGIIVGLLVTLINTNLRTSPLRLPLCVVTLGLIWGFTFVTGLPTSLVRASTMMSIALVAAMLNHNGPPLQHLVLAVAAMLIACPTYLLDVGAQMSVTAVAGIILFYSPLQRWAVRHWRYAIFRLKRRWLYWPVQLVHISIAAQVLTLPLVAWYFHRIPIYGAPASIVLIPLTTVLIYSALSLMAVGGSLPLLTTSLSWCVTQLVAVQVSFLQAVSALPGAVVPDFWSHKTRREVVVYNCRHCPTLHLIAEPDSSWLLMPHPERADSSLTFIANSFWAKRLTASPRVLRDRYAVAAKGFRAVMLCKTFCKTSPRPSTAFAIDLLWLCDGFRGGLTDVLSTFSPKLIVLDASLPSYLRGRLRDEAAQLHIPVYDIHERGALRVRL